MKAPEINKYADGGKASKKYAEKSMTPKEWDEYAAGKKWAQYPGSGVNPRGYKSYYDTTQYKFNVNPETGEVDSRSSVALIEGVPPTAQTIEYDYVNPKLLEKTPQRSFPGVDPNYKPLVIGTAGTYDPNTDINYIDPSKKTGTNPPIVQQYSGGGKITKAPMLKKKVAKYANGTTVAGVQYDENGNPILSSNNQLMQGQPELNATGSSNFYQGYDRNVQGSTQGTGEKKQGNGQMKNAATGALGSYGSGYYANQQPENDNENARSQVLGGVSKMGQIGAVIGGAAAIGDQIGAKRKAEAEQMDAEGNLKDQGKAQRSAISGGLFSPSKALATRGSYKGGWTDITGKKYAEHLETQAKQQINEEARAEAFAKRDAGETMTGGNSVTIEQPEKKKWWQFKAQGGTIEGKGGPKSDSILSKVDEKGIPAGSFITPAENNGLAKALRAKVLGDNPERKAQFKKEGGETAEVAVSNGEHLFTPKEKSKIVQKLGEEILEELAPNAEDDDEMEHEEMSKEEHQEMMKMDMEHKANGGEISATKAREIMRDGTANGKPLTDKQKRYFGWVIGGRKACGGEVKKYADGGEVPKRKNSTGVSGADRLIDDAYKNPPKTEKEYNDLVSKLKILTRGKVNKEVNDFINWSNPARSKMRLEGESKYEENKRLAEYGPDVVKNIKKLKEIGASDDIIKKYTKDASAVGKKQEGLSRSKTPDELFDFYKDRVEDEDFSKNKGAVKKGLDERVQANFKKLETMKNNPEKYTPEDIEKAQEDFDNSAAYRDKLVGDIDKNDLTSYREAKKILSKTGMSFKTEEAPVKKGSQLENLKQEPSDKLGAKKYELPTTLRDRYTPTTSSGRSAVTKKVTEKETITPAQMGTVSPIQTSTEALTTTKGTPEIKAEIKTPGVTETVTEEGTPSQGSKLGRYLKNNAGTLLETGAALGQMGMGLKATKEERPVDEIDPMFLANVSKAQAEAKYGFTPQENFILDQERQNALNAARFAARNYSGGNAASAFNMEKSAINEAYSSALKKAIANKSLMMDKQQYADQMALQKAQMSRQLFGDKMSAWQQNQQAGSALLGSGIKNLIGASRYQKELEAQQQRQQYYNPTFNG